MKIIILAIAVLTLGSGCATIVAGGSDQINVTSNPSGATVYLNGAPMGKTPMQLTIRRHADGHIKIENPGYEPYQVEVNKVVNGWVFGNILLGGVIGLAVDLIASNQGKHPEDPIHVELSKSNRATASEN